MALKATPAAPYNRISGNGLCTTLAGLIAAALGYSEIHRLPDLQKARLAQEVRRSHLLLSAFNALQPGVLAVTGWDLTGALPLEQVPDQFLHPGGQPAEDKRWYNRGAYDLLGIDGVAASPMGIPVAEQLYGTLPQQFADESSFVSRLAVLLAKRDAMKLQSGQFCGVLDLADPALFGMVTLLENRRDGGPHLAITLLNFSREERTIDVTLDVWSSEWLAAAVYGAAAALRFGMHSRARIWTTAREWCWRDGDIGCWRLKGAGQERRKDASMRYPALPHGRRSARGPIRARP